MQLNVYGTVFLMHDQGKDYVMNPYQMVASNGHYYLLGNIDEIATDFRM